MTTTPKLWKFRTQVNTSDADAVQEDGQIAGLLSGGYVVVWTDNSLIHNPFGSAVVAQRYDTAGSKVGGEVNISQFQSGNQLSPAITTLSNGSIAIAFVDSFLGDNDIYVRILDPAIGLVVRSDVIDMGPGQTVNPSLTALPGGGYAIAYTLQNSVNDSDIVARIVSAAGAVGAQFDVDNQTDNRDYSQLTTLSNGNFVVVYQDEVDGSATDTDIKHAIFSPTGAVVFGPNSVAGGADGLQPETHADVAALAGGEFVVGWTETTQNGTDIRATIFNSGGGVLVANIRVNSPTRENHHDATVVALAGGGFVVTWENDFADRVQAQRFDAGGNKIGTDFTVEGGVTGNSPEAALLADGRIAYAVGNLTDGEADVVTSIWDPRTPVQNFDGINQSDFAWQQDSGQAAVWLLNGTSLVSSAAVGPNVGPSWHLRGDGDFSADGRSDFLWQHDSGQAAVWRMNGTNLISGTTVGPNPGPSWHVITSGDFNGDSNDDILWQDNSGQAAIWLMEWDDHFRMQLMSGVGVGPNPGASWHVIDTGDFNGDTKSDILWQDNSGQAAIWLMNGTNLIGGGAVGPNPGPSWQVKASGDFNGDHWSDILWQNDSGQAAIWLMNGTSLLGGAAVGPNPGPSWHVQGTGEFDGDDKSDIVWQNDNGQAAVWLMSGTTLLSGVGVGGSPGADWDLIA